MPIIIIAALLALCAILWPRPDRSLEKIEGARAAQIQLKQKMYFGAAGLDIQGQAQNAILHGFARKRPDVAILPWNMFRLPGNLYNAQDMLAFAGKTAADIQACYFHQVVYYRQQGLLMPLNRWIGDDDNGNGVLEDAEIRWEPWKRVPPVQQRMAMEGTKIYAIPTETFIAGIVWRRDLYSEAGLDPRQGPTTWDELWRFGQQLTDPTKRVAGSQTIGQFAAPADFAHSLFYDLLYRAGGDLARGEVRRAGAASTEPPLYTFSFSEDPYQGPDGRRYRADEVQIRYKATFNSQVAKDTLAFIRKLRFSPWTRCPHCVAAGVNAPIDLTEAQVKAQTGVCPQHGRFALVEEGPNQLIRGILLPAFSPDNTGDMLQRLKIGKVAMLATPIDARLMTFSPRAIGFCAAPSPRSGVQTPIVGIPMFYGVSSDIADADKQQAAWEYLAYRLGPEAKTIEARVYAENGYAAFVRPRVLRLAGLDEYLSEVPPDWQIAYAAMEGNTRTIPYASGWLPLETELWPFLKELVSQEQFDWRARVDDIVARGNVKYFGDISEQTGRKYTLLVTLLCIAVFLGVIVAAVIIVRERARESAESAIPGSAPGRSRYLTIAAWMMLMPAIGAILLWAYYPLVRGALLAFQDYRMRGPIEWVGVRNFIEGLLTGHFLHSLVNTVYFVILMMTIGFAVPIIVAILLSEVPRFKYFFRTVYYLPAVTTGLVITLLWMQFYQPTESGFLNALLKPLVMGINDLWQHITRDSQAMLIQYPIQWLLNKKLAMFSVIIPSVWAGAGPGSLLYLAALKTIPEEMYEAADLDGAGPWQKLRYVTLPYLLPIILINFIGTFIASFQNMGNIFIMTGGGPDYATHVVSLEIWLNAFSNLRYGVATAQAWMLGSILIGFAVLQMRLLNRMNWRRAES
jgi:ABC-type sugar transport system permease subunit/ABC-type glycerol-3-phosphate transport system substrate-binding protein